MTRHIVQSYDEELARIHRQVVEMGGMVADQLERLLKAVNAQDAAGAVGVTKREFEVNAMEVAADTEIFMVLARRCPVARDLRLVMTASKVVTHLERLGDEVAKVANVLIGQLLPENASGIGSAMEGAVASGYGTLALLRHVLALFESLDFAETRRLVKARALPNPELNDSMQRVMEAMEGGPHVVSGAVGRILILKAVDRINDLVYEVAKDIIFLGDGDDAPAELSPAK